MKDANQFTIEFWSPLVRIWEQRIQASLRARAPFDSVLEQCEAFYGATSGFMFSDTYNQKFFDGTMPVPKFKICVNRAWEYVSIVGPSLYWDYAHRKVFSHREFLLTPDMFGDPNDPNVQAMFNQIADQEEQEIREINFRNSMMEAVLNWSQREQPNGLVHHGLLATTQALLSGRGVLWPETYRFPESDETFTMLRYGDVRDLLIDADCTDPLLDSAGYIMRRHVTPTWQVEKIFGLERGSLKSKGTYQSKEQSAREQSQKKEQKLFDCMEWYEVWSRIGIGPHLTTESILDDFDEVVGDYAYLCIAPGVPFPLNAPPELFFGEEALTPEEVAALFEWRAPNYGDVYPIWKDHKFPVALLDFHPLANSAWPMSPLANGIGYLVCLNVLISTYTDRAWDSRKSIVGYLKSAAAEMEKAISTDESICFVALNDNIHQAVNQVISTFEFSGNKDDILQAINMMSDGFDKSVGLSELSYGGNGGRQVRVAADIRERSANLSVRPDKMARDVAAWMTVASRHEMVMTMLHVEGRSIRHLIGEFCAERWDEFRQIPLEQLLREMKTTVEATEIRRPNKERDTANIQSLQQYMLPLLQTFAQQTGNTEPLNAMIKLMGRAIEMDVTEIVLPQWGPPPPDPNATQLQDQMQQMEIQGKQMEIQTQQTKAMKTSAETENIQADTMAKMMENGLGGESKHMQEMRHIQDRHEQKMEHESDKHDSEMDMLDMKSESEQGYEEDAD